MHDQGSRGEWEDVARAACVLWVWSTEGHWYAHPFDSPDAAQRYFASGAALYPQAVITDGPMWPPKVDRGAGGE